MFRLLRRLSVADALTLVNGALGFVAGVVAFADPAVAARLVLVAAMFDALDGIVARRFGSSPVGPLLDSVTDVVSFGVTPGLLIVAVGFRAYGGFDAGVGQASVGVLAVGTLFVLFSVVRTALYTTYVGPDDDRPGVQNTLAATIVAALFLSTLVPTWALLAVSVGLSAAMVAPVDYPKLLVRDAFAMGTLQFTAVVTPAALGALFPRALLVAALAYLFLAPKWYWDGGTAAGSTASERPE